MLIALVVAGTRLLGAYLARVYGGGPAPGDRVFGPVERLLYRLGGRRPEARAAVDASTRSRCSPSAPSRSSASTCSSACRGAAAQPDRCRRRCPPTLAFNTAVSFVTNTNWQNYGGESTMSHLTQMAGLTVQNFVVRRRRHLRRGRVDPRARPPAQRDDRELLGRPRPRRRPACCCRCRVVVALLLASQGVVQSLRGPAEAHDARGRDAGRSTAARSRARRRSRSWARTAAGTSTPTPRTRSRTRRLHEPRPDPRAPADPVRAHVRVRPAWSATSGRAGRSSPRCSRSGSARPAVATHFEADGNPRDRRGRGEHGGQRGALRRARVRPLRRLHDRHLDRRGHRRPRQLHAGRRRRAAREHDARRGLAGRRRRRALRDARLRPARGLHRRADGRTDAGVPRQEDPGARR